MACLDTSVLIDLLRPPRASAHQNAVRIYRRLLESGAEICTTRICEAELRVGLYLGRPDAAQRRNVEELLARLVMLDIGAGGAEQFARIKAHLRKLGKPTGDTDALIAAIALSNGQSLVTRNPRHFGDIPGLAVEFY